MGELCFVSEDPTNTVSRYSSRISPKTWQSYLPVIQCLHEKGLTRRGILNELSKRQFNPSFGQLVGQMARWGLVRYSKPLPVPQNTQAQLTTIEDASCQNDYGTLPLVMTDIAPGIMGVSYILLAAEPVTLTYQNDSVETSYELNQLISDLRIGSDSTHQLIGSGQILVTVSQTHKQRRQLLDAADVLFLGGSYTHAYHTYRDAYRLELSPSQASFEEEQLFVQSIIGCLKSAATDEQSEESISIAQEFLNQLEFPHVSNPNSKSNSQPPCLRNAFETWDSSDCATSKAVFDLLTTYKRHRRLTTTGEAAWAHRMTVHEWVCMRLVRVPLWQDMVNFNFHNSPLSIAWSPSDATFNVENLQSILRWTAIALADIGHWYDEQASTLRAVFAYQSCLSITSASMSHFQALLFWRLAFFSKHNNSPNSPYPYPCPELWVRLSADTVFTAHPLQTASVVAHTLLNDDGNGSSSLQLIISAAHMQKLKRMQAVLEGSRLEEKGWVFSLFWSGLKARLAPSFAQRCDGAPSS